MRWLKMAGRKPKPNKPKRQPLQQNFREQPVSVKDFWLEYLKKGWKLTLFLSIMWGFSIGGIVGATAHDNAAAEARQRLVNSSQMSWVTPGKRTAERKKLGSALLTTHVSGATTDIKLGIGDDVSREIILRQVHDLARTGDPIQLDTTQYSFSKNPFRYLLEWAIGTAAVWWLITTFKYYYRTMLRHEFPADLPWKRGWPFVFVALSPYFAPIMVISAIKMRKRKPMEPVEEETTYQFPDDPSTARATYVALRATEWITHIKSRREAIDARIVELVANLRAATRERGELQAERRELNKTDMTVDVPNAATINAEFDSIMSHASVHRICAHTELMSIHVLVKARYVLEGITYDLGDWEVVVTTSGLTTIELRTGAKVKWHVLGHPIYRLSDGVFCFGARAATINAFLREGKISEAVLQAIIGLNSINDADVPAVPKAFKEAKD